MAGARDGQLRIHRGSDDPPWTVTLYDDAAGQERLPLGRITRDEWLRHREEAIEMHWSGPFNDQGSYYPGDVARVGTAAYVCKVSPAPQLDTRADTFVRADDPVGWGIASDGHSWAIAGPIAPLPDSITSNQGLASSDASENVNLWILGPSMGTADVEMLVRWTVTVSVSGDDGIELFPCMASDGIGAPLISVHINGDVGVQDPAVHTYPGAWAGATVGQASWTRLRLQAGVVAVRSWHDGDTEPDSWDVWRDCATIFIPGHVGLINDNLNPSTTVAVDSFSARMLAPALAYPAADTEHWDLLAG